MSNLFYDQLERGYHGIPEGLIPLSVIDDIKAEIKDESYSKQSFNEDVYEYEDRCIDLEDVVRIIDEKVKEYTS